MSGCHIDATVKAWWNAGYRVRVTCSGSKLDTERLGSQASVPNTQVTFSNS